MSTHFSQRSAAFVLRLNVSAVFAPIVFACAGAVLAQDRYVAYEVPFGIAGNQNVPGALGMDFDVNLNILVWRLGVFDSGSDGLKLPITARLYDRDTGVAQAVIEFTPADPGELLGGSRFKDLDPPLELAGGFHGCIIAEGYGDAEMNGNCHGQAGLRYWTTNDGNCSLAFVGGSRYGAEHGVLPTWIDAGPPDRYAAGTFEFEQLDEPTPTPAVAYIVDALAQGNYAFSGPMGMDFDVQVDIQVNRLGVFDSLSDGLLLPITARLYDRDSRAELASLEFPSEDPGELIDGSRFKDLDPPLGLPAGARCAIVAEGYGAIEPVGTLWAGPLPIRTDSGGCAIKFVGSSRLSFMPGEFPAAPDAGPANRYAAGTLAFEPAPAAVECPSAPTAVQAAVNGDGIEVTWTAPAGGPPVAGYNVYRNTADVGSIKLNQALVTSTSFADTAIWKGIPNCYVVRSALSSGIQSDPSGEACAAPASPPSPGQTFIAYPVPAGIMGNQNVTGSLGMDFETVTEVAVTHLGVFDDRSDGLNSTLTARLYDRNTAFELASLVFTPDEPGDLVGGSRFKDLPSPVGLPAGFRGTIVAEGFSTTDTNGNQNLGPLGLTVDTGGCALRFGGCRTGARGVFPPNRDVSAFAAAYAAGTFEFGPAKPPPAQPQEGIAYEVTAGVRGNQNFGGALGLDFNVEANIVVTQLGVFDDGSDGLALPITAYLYDRDTKTSLASLSFVPGDDGELVGGSRFKDLVPHLSLAAGFHGTIVAEGYGDMEMNGNVHGVEGLAPWTTFDGGCRLSFVGGGRPGPAGAFPENLDWGPVNRYAAGTFYFKPGPVASFTATPEEGTEPLEVSFDASASSSVSGAIADYRWDLGDGQTATGKTLRHTYAKAGYYTVSLTVEDAAGLEASATGAVSVLFRSEDVSPWVSQDIGDPAPIVKGGARPAGAGCLEVYAGGKDIALAQDQFHFVHQQVAGDVTLTARVSEVAWPTSAKLGLMLREDLTPGSRHTSILLVNAPTPKYSFIQRKKANGPTSVPVDSAVEPVPPDAWVRIERKGAEVIASFSSNGTDWTPLGQPVTPSPPFADTIFCGIAATARDGLGARTSVDAKVCNLVLEGGVTLAVFRRGDADAKGGVPNITDGIYVLNYLFLGGPEPPCLEAADADNKGGINITDGIYILNYLFQGGPAPPSPGPDACGPDTDEPGSAGDVGCETYDPAGC